ncbi:hypothetical protein AOLI_G00152690 [Acnodon oligacanthus]
MSFPGLINYCDAWMPGCSYCDKILRLFCKSDAPDTIKWTTEMAEALSALKLSLCSAPGLGLSEYTRSFHLCMHEHYGVAADVLAQQHGGHMRPVAHSSKTLDVAAQGLPACLWAAAAAGLMVPDAEKIVLSPPQTPYTSHPVLTVLNSISTQHMTAQRRSGSENIVTCTSSLSIVTSSPQTPVFHLHRMLFLPGSEFLPETHDCCADITEEPACCADLLSPLEHGERSKPCDGSLGYSGVDMLPFLVTKRGELL